MKMESKNPLRRKEISFCRYHTINIDFNRSVCENVLIPLTTCCVYDSFADCFRSGRIELLSRVNVMSHYERQFHTKFIKAFLDTQWKRAFVMTRIVLSNETSNFSSVNFEIVENGQMEFRRRECHFQHFQFRKLFIGSKIRHIRGNEKMRGKSAREENWEKFMGSCAFLALVSIVIYLTITIKHFCELWIFLQMRFLISLADFSLFIDFNLVSLFSAFLYKLRQWTKYGNCLRDFLCSLNCRLSCSSRLKIWISIFFRGCE